MEHIGSGKDWDLSRKNGGIAVLPPYGEGNRAGLYRGRLDALMRIINYISNSTQEFVIMSDCDMICNINYKKVINFHIDSGADITAVYHDCYIDKETAPHSVLYNAEDENDPDRITGVFIQPWYVESGTFGVSMNTWVMRREYMLNMLNNAIAAGKTHFARDILLAEADTIRIMGYKHKGYSAHINSLDNYFKHNMEMLDSEKRSRLFYGTGRNVYTKVRDSEPARYGENANVTNSLVADGCVINGTVENSIISRGVKIDESAVVKNCIIMQDGIIAKDCQLEWVIADKSVIITDGKRLSADEKYPMYITKNKRV